VQPELKYTSQAQVVKVDRALGLVFGFAIVCKQDGKDYVDLQGDLCPEDEMLAASAGFMQEARVAKEMHGEEPGQGTVVFAFPLTGEIARALEITTKRTGLLIGMKPDAETLKKFADGTYTGFSIGGMALREEPAAA